MREEISTIRYTVYITDENNTVSGSGILFYPGGDELFVFACAHTVDRLDKVKLFFLKVIDAAKENYKVICVEALPAQIVYSPTDSVREEGGNRVHSEDYVIIKVAKPSELDLLLTEYSIGETFRNEPFYTRGYPGIFPKGVDLIEALETLHGQIVNFSENSNRFVIRFTEPFLNNDDRFTELQGLSGAPVWDGNYQHNESMQSLLGIVTSTFGNNATLAKVFAVKIKPIRVLMEIKFGIQIGRSLLGEITEEEVAGKQQSLILYKHAKKEISFKKGFHDSENDIWAEDKYSACRLHIDELQLQKAIDDAREAINDCRFNHCSQFSQRRLMQLLLYCYEIGDLVSEFDDLEQDMRNRGLIKKYDVLRHLTRSFMKKEYNETVRVAKECIDNPESSASILIYSKTFLLLAKAYTDDLPLSETIGKLLDPQENLIYENDEFKDSALLYQMIGYVYGDKYRDYINSVRFINRSYQIGYDTIVLESAAAAYYFLGISDAERKDGTVNIQKLNKKALYKARDYFLTIITKADALYWAGTVRRVGLLVYNTFVFLNDTYRIITVYPDIKKYVRTDDKIVLHDIEIKYARVLAQAGNINLDAFSYITPADKLFLETVVKTGECNRRFERTLIELSTAHRKPVLAEEFLRETIAETENTVRKLNKNDRIPIYVNLMDMYGYGMLLFGWKKGDKLKYCYEHVKDCGDPVLLESMENYIFEFEAPLTEAIERYKKAFEKNNDIFRWNNLQRFYVRHGLFAEADAMYRELLAERKELISDEPEYAYRAYIDYVMLYHRDLKDALQCFLDAKKSFKDTDVAGFWEHELMFYTNTFNDPESFELVLKPFLEKGLIAEERYNRTVLIVNLVNLKTKRATEAIEIIRKYPHFVNPVTNMIMMSREELQYFSWAGDIKPNFAPPPKGMLAVRVRGILRNFEQEIWHKVIEKTQIQWFKTNKKLVMDAWTLFILHEQQGLEVLKQFDCVYISHFPNI